MGAFIDKIKEIINKMIGKNTIEQTLHIKPVISNEMENSITLWGEMYKNKAPWLHEPTLDDPARIVSLGIPALIASEKARTALLEWKIEITTPSNNKLDNVTSNKDEKFTNQEEPKAIGRAAYIDKYFKANCMSQMRRQLEYACAKGGIVIKPYVVISNYKNADGIEKQTASIEFDFVQADNFYPLSYDSVGRITEAAFLEMKPDKDSIYYRVEHHKWENNICTIINKAFKADNQNNVQVGLDVDLGKEIPLTSVPEWGSIQPKATIYDIDRPMFAYLKMPEANTVDTFSPLGVSCYSRVVNQIKDADIQYSNLLWEYEAGAIAVDIDRDALKTDSDSSIPPNIHTYMGQLQNRLFRKIDLGVSETYQQYAPTLRDSAYIQGLNAILMRIEDNTGLSRGTISDASAEARTATELKILKQRSFAANKELQDSIESALRDVLYVMDIYCTLYNLAPSGEYEASFEWDDSILVDVESELNKRINLYHNNLASRVELRMWYYGETERQAREALAKIDQENQSDMDNNLTEMSKDNKKGDE